MADNPKKLAGSPWADITPLRRRGRPRKFATKNPTERKRASRAAQKLKEEAEAAEKDRLAQIAALEKEQAKDDNGKGRSLLLSEATTNSGILQGDWAFQFEGGTMQTGSINALTSVNMSASIPIAFLVGVTFSISGAGNSANMYMFNIQS
jgi:hypothetical protein